jgi:hypothetical protein
MIGDTPKTHQQRFHATGITAFVIVLLWGVCLNTAKILFKENLLPSGIISWAVAFLPLAIGALVIWFHFRHLQTCDELQRKIQLDALALGFGITVIAITTYPVLELAGAPHLKPNYFLIAGVLTYMGACIYGTWRHK